MAIRKGSTLSSKRLLMPIGSDNDQCLAQFAKEQKDLIGFSTSVKRLLALMRQASERVTIISLGPKADEWEY